MGKNILSHVELSLTRALKQVSGWEDTPDLLVKFSLGDEPIKLPNMKGHALEITTLSGQKEWEEPYYTIDYLLENMPAFVVIDRRPYFLGFNIANMDEKREYIAAYYHYSPSGPNGQMIPLVYRQSKAAEPQDALAKLAFKLFMDDQIWKLPVDTKSKK